MMSANETGPAVAAAGPAVETRQVQTCTMEAPKCMLALRQ